MAREPQRGSLKQPRKATANPRSTDALGFQGTSWPTVKAAASPDSQVRFDALSKLVEKYSGPLRAYLRASLRWHGNAEDRINECLNSFVLKKILIKNIIANADSEVSLFRNYLKTCIRNFALQEFRAEAVHNGPLVPWPDSDSALPGGAAPACPASDREWAQNILNEALSRMKTDCTEAGQEVVWAVFDRRRLLPLASAGEMETLQQTADYIGRAFPSLILQSLAPKEQCQIISNRQTTGDNKFRRCIRDVLAEYCPNAEDIEDELNSLITLLASGVDLNTRLRPAADTRTNYDRLTHNGFDAQ